MRLLTGPELSIRESEPIPEATRGQEQLNGQPTFGAMIGAFVTRWPIIVGAMAATSAAAILYLAVATPQYTATTLLVIDTKSNGALRATSVAPTDANVESATIESLVEILKSERVLKRVVEEEGLVDDPALKPGTLASAVASLRGLIPFGSSANADSGPDAKAMGAARALQKLTNAKRLGLTYVVEISASMPNGQQAARVANAYAKAFIAEQMGRREDLARNMSQLLAARTTELQDQAQNAEQTLEQFKFEGAASGENSAASRVTLRKLESAAQTYRVLHDNFLERYAETWQQQFLSLPDAQIASPAFAPQSKSSPRGLIILAAALVAGFALGLMIIVASNRKLFGLSA